MYKHSYTYIYICIYIEVDETYVRLGESKGKTMKRRMGQKDTMSGVSGLNGIFGMAERPQIPSDNNIRFSGNAFLRTLGKYIGNGHLNAYRQDFV